MDKTGALYGVDMKYHLLLCKQLLSVVKTFSVDIFLEICVSYVVAVNYET